MNIINELKKNTQIKEVFINPKSNSITIFYNGRLENIKAFVVNFINLRNLTRAIERINFYSV